MAAVSKFLNFCAFVALIKNIQVCALSDFIALPGVQLVSILPIICYRPLSPVSYKNE